MSGNEKLIADLKCLLQDAKEYVFDDFKSGEATPRMNLDKRLNELQQNNREGKYDG